MFRVVRDTIIKLASNKGINSDLEINSIVTLGKVLTEINLLLRFTATECSDKVQHALWLTLCSFAILLKSRRMLQGKLSSIRGYLISLVQASIQSMSLHSVIKTFVCDLMSEIRKIVSDMHNGISVYDNEDMPNGRALLDMAVDLQFYRKNINGGQYSKTKIGLVWSGESIFNVDGSIQTTTAAKTPITARMLVRGHSSSELKNRLKIGLNRSNLMYSDMDPVSNTSLSHKSR